MTAILSQEAQDVLARFPNPVRLWPSARRYTYVLLGASAFALVGFWMLNDGIEEGRARQIISGGLLAAVILAVTANLMALIRGQIYVALDAEHFTWSLGLGRTCRLRWKDIRGFYAKTHRFTTTVYWDDLTASPRIWHVLPEIFWKLGIRPDLYGFTGDDLAALLNAWRARAIRDQARSAATPRVPS
jgi:hypothetical protein